MENIEKDTNSEDYGRREQYIVIARVGTEYEDCQVVPEDAIYPDIYRQVFGPSSREECEHWQAKNCTGGTDSREQYIVVALLGTEYRGCRVVKEGSILPAIYMQVYGPSSKEKCEAWMAENCDESAGSREKIVYKIVDAKVEILESRPPQVSIVAQGVVRTRGWTRGRLDPYIYVQPPPDGIWDFDFVATQPDGPAGDALTPITSAEYLMPLPRGFRGVRIHAETNKMEFFPTNRQDAEKDAQAGQSREPNTEAEQDREPNT